MAKTYIYIWQIPATAGHLNDKSQNLNTLLEIVFRYLPELAYEIKF